MIFKTPQQRSSIYGSCRLSAAIYLLISLIVYPSLLSGQDKNTARIDSLRKVVDLSQGMTRIMAYIDIFDVYFPKDIAKARQIANESFAYAEQINKNEEKAASLELLGEIYMYQGKFDSLFVLNQRILPLVKDLENKKYLSSAYGNIGIYYERMGSLDSALHYNLNSFETSLEEDKYKCYNNLGRIYQRLGDTNKSLEFFENAMSAAKKYGQKNAEAIISNNVGSLYATINIKHRAKELFFRSIELKRELNDKRGELFALLNLVLTEDFTKEEENAFLEQGISIAEEIQFDAILSIFLAVKSTNLISEGKIDEGLDLVMPRYIKSKENPSFEFPFLLKALANLYLEKGQFDVAEKYAKEYLSYGDENLALDDQQSARSLLKNIYEKQGNASKYFEVARTYYTIKDSINDQINVDKYAYLDAALDEEQNAKVELLNLSIKEKTASRNQLAIIGLLLTLLLSSLLYFRNKLVNSQKKVIQSDKESAAMLSEKNKLLEEHDELKNRLYTNITHEFRTPLTIIHGVVQQLSKHEDIVSLSKRDESIPKQLKIIQKNGNNLLDMVNNILDLSKLEKNALDVNMTQGDIIQYLKYLSESFESLVIERKINLHYDSEDEEIMMDYDPEKIRQIFSNLISNAIKYTPEGGEIKVKIRQINEAFKSPSLQILIADSGSGIPAESLPYIFDRFYQVNDTKSKAGGTGIGLAFCKELVSLLGGSISVDSEVEKGSTFTILLPITNDALMIEKEYSMSKDAVLKTIGQKGILENQFKASILIIEDNPDVANFVASCLNDKYQVDMASNGKIGIKKALDNIPDLIITDIMMPEKDGYEVSAFLKKNELTSHIPIIMLTAKSDQESKLIGLETGADDYLLKPFDTEELGIKVHNLIESRAVLKDYFMSSAALRTHPQKANATDKLFYDKVYDIVESNLSNEQFGVEYLAEALHMSKVHLNRKIKAMTDLSTNKFIQSVRLKHAMAILKKGEQNVSEIAQETGFSSLAYFVKCFREQYNVTPGSLIS